MSCEISYPLIYARPLVGGKRPKGKQKTQRYEGSVDTHWSALVYPGSLHSPEQPGHEVTCEPAPASVGAQACGGAAGAEAEAPHL